MANSKNFETKTTVTVADGLELDIVGEIYDNPIFPGSNFNSRILVIDNVGNQVIGTLMLPGKQNRDQLQAYMKDVIANPLKYKDKIL